MLSVIFSEYSPRNQLSFNHKGPPRNLHFELSSKFPLPLNQSILVIPIKIAT
jgi:hypothetical protein